MKVDEWIDQRNRQRIPINFRKKTGKFSTQCDGASFESATIEGIHAWLGEKTKIIFDWAPIIEVRVYSHNYTSKHATMDLAISAGRYYISPTDSTRKKYCWMEWKDGDEDGMVKNQRIHDSFCFNGDWKRDMAEITVPCYINNTHFLPYHKELWGLLVGAQEKLELLQQRINGALIDYQRIPEHLMQALLP